MKLALYARCSTARGKCKDCHRGFAPKNAEEKTCPWCHSSNVDLGQNPETQLLPLRQYAAMKGAEYTEYVDRGVSGGKEKRPALDLLMKEARQGKFDAVVIARFDRFARSVRHLVEALEEFRALKIGFVSLNEAIDTNTPVGRMVFTIIAAIAQFERDIIRERIMAGLARAEAAGKIFGAPRKIRDFDAMRKYYAECQSLRKTGVRFKVSKNFVKKVLVGETYYGTGQQFPHKTERERVSHTSSADDASRTGGSRDAIGSAAATNADDRPQHPE